MTGKTFLNRVANGETDVIQLLLSMLDECGASYCVIGGLGVNAYAEPVVSLDLDLVVVSDRVAALREIAAAKGMTVQDFEHSVNMSVSGSDLRIQLQSDPRYQEFISRAERHAVLGYEMSVACIQDVLRGKIWAYSDETRRQSKRQKDLSDIMRLVETHPELKPGLPPEIADKIE
ncbi:MAG TPA: hypothetical protein ENN03_06080 [bacterium]|nr:hypothetical protein [bacterium]